MQTEIIVALITLFGSGVGAFLGVITSAKLTQYRLEQLEKTVAQHNNLIDRTYQLEEGQKVLEEKVKVANHRIEDLERR